MFNYRVSLLLFDELTIAYNTFLKMFVLHLLLLFDLVFCSWDYEVSSYPSYSSINYGLFNKFNRHEPFVLFRTKYGLQQLTGNGTCYTSKSIYQPSTNLIDYWEYSIDDNYIGWVNKEINQYCSKNLFNEYIQHTL